VSLKISTTLLFWQGGALILGPRGSAALPMKTNILARGRIRKMRPWRVVPTFPLVLSGHSVIQVAVDNIFRLGALLCFAGLTALGASPGDQEKLASANMAFAFDLLKQIVAEQTNHNIFISPFSVSSVLQMVGNGAAGGTKAEMQRVLKTGGVPAETLNAACKDLNQSLNSQTNVILNLANAIWYKKEFHLKPEFVSVNKQFFQADLAGVDFTKLESAQTINHWADVRTRGKIKEVVQWPFDPLTRVILANAIYFKGKWDRPFDKSGTKQDVFHLSAGGEKQVPMMWQHGHFNYQQDDGFQAVRLPYAGGHLQMYLFLPDTNSSPTKLLADWTADAWRDKILPKFQDKQGMLALPRFKMEYDVMLNDPLMALGMKQAFAKNADFSAMADEPLFVSEVKQKSFVEVNEEGTEATAVTTASMRATAVFRPEKPFEMIVDRPFLFVIADDQTKSILFMGVIYDPAG
jgi:serpin B